MSSAVADDYLHLLSRDLLLPQGLVEFRLSPPRRPRTKADVDATFSGLVVGLPQDTRPYNETCSKNINVTYTREHREFDPKRVLPQGDLDRIY